MRASVTHLPGNRPAPGSVAEVLAAALVAATRQAHRRLSYEWPGRSIDLVLDAATLRHPFPGDASVWINGLAAIDGWVVEVCVRSPRPGPFSIGAADVAVDCAAWTDGQMRLIGPGSERGRLPGAPAAA